MDTICRAITFINYHIPLAADEGIKPPYGTIGFFDGMFTEKLDINYNKYDMKQLWKYTVKKTAESQGKFSYQNIFGFSKNSWNLYTDEDFWAEGSDHSFPLLFVTFLQLSDYMAGKGAIEQQCQFFNDILANSLGSGGMHYVYSTIDKNDFIICIRSQNHTNVVNTIKKLHGTKHGVVYSYSILSISHKVLDSISENTYPYLFEQSVDSICLKGITNSFDPYRKMTLDQRYYEFCDKLITKLYPSIEKGKPEEEREYRIYDIMGDNDFRLIARHVNLGKLLREFGINGLLSYYQSDFRFYLYSSSLVLNTMTGLQPPIDSSVKAEALAQMNHTMQSPLCEQLSKEMPQILKILSDWSEDEKKVTFCQALWQLLQSLKVLESAPTKKYDFCSLYHPFAALVRILESKMNQSSLSDNDRIYEFIHKISMTLHGTLRTDIQFFQIRDFNVIVHYAPAKLRAFYAIWALMLSNFYNSFEQTNKKYSFILSPGVFGKTKVQQLFLELDETERLMLITIPERNLYIPQWLSIILAHEVSHFVGTRIRERQFRHKILLRLAAHITSLEMQYFWYYLMPDRLKPTAERMIKESDYLRRQLKKELRRSDENNCLTEKPYKYLYHSEKSIEIIRKDYRYIEEHNIVKKIVYDYGSMLKKYLLSRKEPLVNLNYTNPCQAILDLCNECDDMLLPYFERFQQAALPSLLTMLNYIITEAFADMIAILTLDLSPVKHIKTFVKNEHLEYAQDQNAKGIHLLPVRIAITMDAVKEFAQKNKNWLISHNSQLAQSWTDDIFRKTIFELENNSTEQNLMLMVYGYRTDLTYKSHHIRNYVSLYNPLSGKETFSNKTPDFFNDKCIYKLMCGYLYKCANTYFTHLKDNQALEAMREKLLKTYQVLASESVIDVIQEIEDFLKAHASDC